MKTRMNNVLDKPYDQDEFFKKWSLGLSKRTRENYGNGFNDWFVFIDITPAEQIKKRMHDLTMEDMRRLFFEKFRAIRSIWVKIWKYLF
jgi:hypothetical protein